jgi:hypothetical protein
MKRQPRSCQSESNISRCGFHTEAHVCTGYRGKVDMRTFLGHQFELDLLQVDLGAGKGGLQRVHLSLGLVEVDHDALTLLLCHSFPLLQVLQNR